MPYVQETQYDEFSMPDGVVLPVYQEICSPKKGVPPEYIS